MQQKGRCKCNVLASYLYQRICLVGCSSCCPALSGAHRSSKRTTSFIFGSAIRLLVIITMHPQHSKPSNMTATKHQQQDAMIQMSEPAHLLSNCSGLLAQLCRRTGFSKLQKKISMHSKIKLEIVTCSQNASQASNRGDQNAPPTEF